MCVWGGGGVIFTLVYSEAAKANRLQVSSVDLLTRLSLRSVPSFLKHLPAKQTLKGQRSPSSGEIKKMLCQIFY